MRQIFTVLASAVMLLLVCDFLCARESQSSKNQYLGQNPPGNIAELFAPDIIPNKVHSAPVFMADYSEVYWSQYYVPEGKSSRIQHIFCSRNVNGAWTTPEVVSFSGKYNDGSPSLTADGKQMFFVSNRPASGPGPAADEYLADVWSVDRTEAGWGTPKRLDINSPEDESAVSVAADGTLYFCSNRKSNIGIIDIYISEPVNGKYMKATNIGKPISSSKIEFGPWIAPDESYLIFSYSSRSAGNGIHISYRSKAGNWGEPIRLGGEINSGRTHRFPGVTPDGKYFFFSKEGMGKRRIYWIDAEFIVELNPAR